MDNTVRLHWQGTRVQDKVTGDQAGNGSTGPWRVRKLPSFKTSESSITAVKTSKLAEFYKLH